MISTTDDSRHATPKIPSSRCCVDGHEVCATELMLAKCLLARRRKHQCVVSGHKTVRENHCVHHGFMSATTPGLLGGVSHLPDDVAAAYVLARLDEGE